MRTRRTVAYLWQLITGMSNVVSSPKAQFWPNICVVVLTASHIYHRHIMSVLIVIPQCTQLPSILAVLTVPVKALTRFVLGGAGEPFT